MPDRLPPHLIAWFRHHLLDLIAFGCAFVFASWLMISTFGYQDGHIVLSMHIWSDFWANIPLIRSFSMGDNIPPEYPIFAGERIRYHFLFFFLVGMLERLGLRIDVALNTLSIFGMTGLLFAVYMLAKHLFKSKAAGCVAMVFLTFNSSLSWVYFIFGKLQLHSPQALFANNIMATHGPYDNSIVSAFWKLNIFTNQRHLAFSFMLMFVGIWAILRSKRKWGIWLGILLIITLSWMHKAILLLSLIQLGFFFIAKSSQRKIILGAILVIISLSLPGITYLNGSGIHSEKSLQISPGFLYQSTSWHEFGDVQFSKPLKWLIYWGLNWGILPLTAFLGWITYLAYYVKTDKRMHWVKQWVQRLQADGTVWFIGAVSVFILANVVTFASDIATNHKLLNYSQFIFGVFSAGLITLFINRRNWIAIPLSLILILGGLFDIIPLSRDMKAHWPDFPKDPIARWIYLHTPADSVFLNTSYGTNSVTTAGRKIYWGWDYFTGGIGYDLPTRRTELVPVLMGQLLPSELCVFLSEKSIDYIYVDNLDPTLFLDIRVNKEYFSDQFPPIASFESHTIYAKEEICVTSDTAFE